MLQSIKFHQNIQGDSGQNRKSINMEITRNMNFAGVPWPGVQREYSKDEKDFCVCGFLIYILIN